MEHDEILSPEDEALFATSNYSRSNLVDRASMLFIAILTGISMLAGLFGGLAVALVKTCVLVGATAD
jgi:hypothetical protein